MHRTAIAAILALAPALSTAAPLGEFSQVIYFGDSLTDGGAAFALTNGAGVPIDIYPNGQLTNGDVWAVQLGGTFANGTNFAVGGAEAVAEPDDISPDLGQQIDSCLASGIDLGLNALGMVLIGANDLGEANSEPEAYAISTEVIGAIVAGVGTLLNNGIPTVAVFGMPDLGIFPSVVASGQSALATAFTPVFNTALQTALDTFFAPGQTVYVDTFSIFDNILKNPDAYGITNTTDACLAEAIACLSGDPNTFFFYDTVHPTEAVHTAFADAVRQQFVPPVPLPATAGFLVAGLGFLMVLRRTRTTS